MHHINRLQIKMERNNTQLQEGDYKPFVRSFMAHQEPNYLNRQEIENPTLRVPSGYFQVKADLQTRILIGTYYNTQPRVTFDCLKILRFLAKRVTQKIPSLTSLDPHQDQTSVTKGETSTPKTNSNQLDIIPGPTLERPYLTQTLLQQNIGRQIQEIDSTTKTQMTCPEED